MESLKQTAEPAGRIVTFYSYKGGTGRSMAVANLAWILATNGKRVLLIDWDLEAPGLHRYLHPFMDDKELSDSPGLIDYFVDFATEARVAAQSANGPDASWHERYLDLLGYVRSLEWEFEKGSLDFVPAGKQSAAYAVRVNTFDWQEIYTKLGGGVLLESLKRQLRVDYDYILIDSRTGISDTSGMCTVQMPDDLVVCYTLNRQSVRGAAAVARSAFEQRRKANGEPGLRIWPVAMRIELAEKERLEEARQYSRAEFEAFVMHLPRRERDYYWGRAEVLYQPYFAYDEVLAVFADQRRHPNSMLASFEAIASYVTRGEVTELGPIPDNLRQSTLKLFVAERAQAVHASPAGKIYVNYFAGDGPYVTRLLEALGELGPDVVLFDRAVLRLGDNVDETLARARSEAAVFLVVYGHERFKASPDVYSAIELREILASGKRIVPVLVGNMLWGGLPEEIRGISGVHLREVQDPFDLEIFRRQLQQLLQASAPTVVTHADDPQKGQWGGKTTRNGRTISADVRPISDDWFDITVQVQGQTPLTEAVTFYLHPSFVPAVQTVPPADGVAVLRLQGWGAFTIGAVADSGRTILEIDLAEVSSAPEKFRER
jgi:MinD-like ATPase involved in chromosome partitioning or flagellar assembly